MSTRSRVSLQQQAVVAVSRASVQVRRRIISILSDAGLSRSQYNVLRILRGAPDGLATMEISDRLIDQVPGITRLIDALEGQGHVERVRSALDRRCIVVRITPSGLEVLRHLDPPIEEADQHLMRKLTKSHLLALIESLDQVGT